MVVFQSENLRTKFSESLTIHLIHACIIMSIHQVLRGESQVSVNIERTWWQTESSLKGSRFIKTLLMFRLIGLFNLTAQCICIFSHFIPVVLSHDEVLPGWGVHEAWRKLAGFQKEKKKQEMRVVISTLQIMFQHCMCLWLSPAWEINVSLPVGYL